jgi:hypothetical protein
MKENKYNKDMMTLQKTFFCAMVREKHGNADDIWISKQGCRTSVHPQYEKCKGKIHGYFPKNDYWFAPRAPHMCQVKGCLSIRAIDQRPPLTMITATQSWEITNIMIHSMISDLKRCLPGWRESLPKQGKGWM